MLRPTQLRLAAPGDGSDRICDLAESWADEMTLTGNRVGYVTSQKKEVLHICAGRWQVPADITPETLREWMTGLRKAGRRGKTIKNYRDTMARFCAYLVGKKLLAENPVVTLPVPIVEKNQARVVPTEAEMRALILAAHRDWRARDLWLGFYTMAVTGLRVSECKGLAPAMVPDDPAVNWIDLPSRLTKTNRAERCYLTRELHELLRAHKAAAGLRPLLFVSGFKRQQVKVYARKGRVEAVRGEQTLSYHSFRHFAAARLSANRADMDLARWAMRHMPQNLTATVYNFTLHEHIAEFFARMPPLLAELELSQVKRGPKGLTEPGRLPDTAGAEVLTHMPDVYPHNTTSTAPLAGGSPPPSASATDLGIPERGARGREQQGVAQLGRARGLGPRGRAFKSLRPDLAGSGPAAASPRTAFMTPPEGTRPEVRIQRPPSGADSDPAAPDVSPSPFETPQRPYPASAGGPSHACPRQSERKTGASQVGGAAALDDRTAACAQGPGTDALGAGGPQTADSAHEHTDDRESAGSGGMPGPDAVRDRGPGGVPSGLRAGSDPAVAALQLQHDLEVKRQRWENIQRLIERGALVLLIAVTLFTLYRATLWLTRTLESGPEPVQAISPGAFPP